MIASLNKIFRLSQFTGPEIKACRTYIKKMSVDSITLANCHLLK
jgi:hypothetical protein